jgi:hypothetical protein
MWMVFIRTVAFHNYATLFWTDNSLTTAIFKSSVPLSTHELNCTRYFFAMNYVLSFVGRN